MNGYTDAELTEIEVRAEKASHGPWVSTRDQVNTGNKYNPPEWYIAMPSHFGDSTCLDIDDAAFIAHARTDVPRLVAELREARKQLGMTCEEPSPGCVCPGCTRAKEASGGGA